MTPFQRKRQHTLAVRQDEAHAVVEGTQLTIDWLLRAWVAATVRALIQAGQGQPGGVQ